MNRIKPLRGLSRRVLLAACTGVLALAFSAVPALALWLGDAQLFAQPHERTRQAGALAPTSDDLYLTRILKKSSQQEPTDFYRLTYMGSMSWVANETVQGYLDVLYKANALPEEWWRYCSDHIEQSFVAADRLGFFHYTAYVADTAYTNSEFCYTVGITVEGESQKIVGVWVSVPQELSPSAPHGQAVLEAYCAYLELEAFEDWEDPADTWFAGSALYSARAEVMLFCETGSYPSRSYSGPFVSEGLPTEHFYDRRYFCLHASSVPDDTVRSWQEYARSFPKGADVWGRGGPPAASGETANEAMEEEALG